MTRKENAVQEYEYGDMEILLVFREITSVNHDERGQNCRLPKSILDLVYLGITNFQGGYLRV